MKYSVYAALIATTSAGPFADEFAKSMPTVEEIGSAEDKMTAWVDEAEKIKNEGKPITDERNKKIEKALKYAEKKAIKDFKNTVEDIQEAEEELVEELMEAQIEFEEEMKMQGIVTDGKALEKKIKADLEKCSKNMRRVRTSTMALKSQKFDNVQSLGQWTNEFKKDIPTKEEINAVEDTIDGWVARAEQIEIDATPAAKNAHNKMKFAWKMKEKADEQTFKELIGELEDAEKEFEESIMKTQAQLEATITENGAIADQEALEKQIQADLNNMKQMHRNVRKLNKKVSLVKRASIKMTTNLNEVSQEMSQKKITAAEFDKAKETVYSWVSDYEDILEKAKPSIMKREKEVEDAIMDHEEDVEDTLEEAVEDFESNGKLLEKVVTRAEEQSMDQLKAKQIPQKVFALGDKIEKDLKEMEDTYNKMHMIKKQIAAQSLQSRGPPTSEQVFEELPTGAQVEKFEDMVIGWTDKEEKILDKVLPAAKLQEDQNKVTIGKTFETVHQSGHAAVDEWKFHEDLFEVVAKGTEKKLHDQLAKNGVIQDVMDLDEDIDNQFQAWGMMKKRAVVQSLTASQNYQVGTQLRSLESDLDRILNSL